MAQTATSVMTQSETSEAFNDNPDGFALDTRSFLRIAAIAVLWAWTFLVFYSSTNLLPLDPDLIIEPVFRAIGFFAIAASFAVVTFLNNRIAERTEKRALTVIVMIGSPWTPVLSFVGTELSKYLLIAEGTSWILLGAASASLMHLARPVPRNASLKVHLFEISLAFSIGALIYLVISSMPREISLLALIPLPYLSLLFLALSKSAPPPETFDGILADKTPWNYLKESFVTQPSQVVNQAIFGMAMGIGINTSISISNTFPLSLAFAFCLAGPIGMIMTCFLDQFTLEKVQWYIPPLILLGLLPITLGLPTVTAACCALLAFCYNTYGLIHTMLLIELIKEQPRSSASIFSSGKAFLYAGNALGWTAACIAHRSVSFASWQLSAIIIALSLATVFVICYSGRPWNIRQEGNVCALPLIDTPKDEDAIIAQMAEEAGLTARQTEVFGYLARGRNAPYICDKLVLSYHTVKAHMYRIYQKLDIHTQQELLDMVGVTCTKVWGRPALRAWHPCALLGAHKSAREKVRMQARTSKSWQRRGRKQRSAPEAMAAGRRSVLEACHRTA